MKILIAGGAGYLGSVLIPRLLDHGHEIDVVDLLWFGSYLPDSVNLIKKDIKSLSEEDVSEYEQVIFLAGLSNDPVKSFLVNGLGASNLALLSNELDYRLIHFSTDYVFNGLTNKPYVENDIPLPLNVYGNTKLAGENFIRSIAKEYYILRISGIYSHNECRAKSGLNFVSLMLKLSSEREEVRVVDNERLSPTYTMDICKQLKLLISKDDYGLFHVTTEEGCSWYEFAQKIFEINNIKTRLSIADPKEFSAKVPRPKYSVLENSNLNKIKINIMPHWETSLQRYFVS